MYKIPGCDAHSKLQTTQKPSSENYSYWALIPEEDRGK